MLRRVESNDFLCNWKKFSAPTEGCFCCLKLKTHRYKQPMSSRRSSLLTVNSLTRLLSKGYSLDNVDSIKICNTWKTLCTSAERLDFQSVSAYHQDDSLNYQQSHAKFYPTSPNGTNSYQSQYEQSSDNVNQTHASGFCGGSSVHNPKSFHQCRGYFEGLQNEIGNKQTEHGGNFGGIYEHKNDTPERFSSGTDQIFDEPNLNSNINVFQHNLARQRGVPDGYCGRNNTGMQQNLDRAGVGNSKGFGKHLSAFVENQDGFYAQQNLNGMSGNLESSYASWTEGPRARAYHSNTYSSQILSEPVGNLKGNLDQNCSSFQYEPKNQFPWNNKMSNQCDPGSGAFPWNIKESQYPPHLQTAQSSTIGSQLSNNAKPEIESAEAFATSPYKDNLEELDNFCKEGKVKEAVEILGLLKKRHIQVDLPRYLQLMHQCGEAKALEEAKIIHKHVLQYLSPLNVSIYNKILEMYSKCGSMDDAFKVFNNMPKRNLTTWDTMITWLAKNELAEDSIDLFTQFKKMGLKPDGKMFIGVFAACIMLGDIDEGILHFESMSKSYGIVPSMAHYISVVDMFGSIGHLDEAFQFVENMPVEPNADVWETLMNHCRIHGNLDLGDRCSELVEQLDPCRLNEQSKAGLVPVKTSDLAKEKEKKKLVNQNLLEVRSRVHEYRAGDTSHPENDKIYALLRSLRSQMKEAGYIPETRFVLHDIDQEGKEEALLAHSERLAVGYGLLTSSARSPIRVIKNLRFCGDCHNALKIISKIVGRDLIIRDAKRFHHFSDGVCSCGDYW
ncbi:pentatricopeptide repeat-containing protein At2g25580-like isoform X1 [Prosopis cineraria]|uniref:pentatricopeptide repeat-containing protein At2g25580-like isoform X1 n=2 Tax=Prosopis cineraria TaxID=364024 RepID=UPI00240F53BD|nr:pentatricopeptide repeat-containing protein At2g25580-like isoform X1 [Prosopis cineraria]XP_054777332.1 pentatricopeptide repeat-containing protein At2g25580-like isoform X1 [Prosopis cineraria]XP_054777333.1 pentatricopeptide repeat-containing protein At2g25580-like isoform X1 [Prosopis cineraria]